MSIIHDALKKIQQELAPKTDEAQASSSPVPETASDSLYEIPPAVKTLPPMKNKIKSTVALSAAFAVTAASMVYIYQQFQNNIPDVKTLAKKSFYKLTNKDDSLASVFKAKTPENPVPLATLTVNPPKPPNPLGSTKLLATSDTPKSDASLTLNIHGVMSNDRGNVVLINDQVYQEGDDVNGVKIVKISLDSITIINNGKEETIHVKG